MGRRESSAMVLLALVLLHGVQAGRVLPVEEPDVSATVKATRVSVIIIGAGMSGITAGKTLSENGVKDLLILEARDEIGGRMMTHDFGGITIEKGANWIEGVNGPNVNPIIPIAKEIGLVNDRSDFENITNNIYGANGKVDLEVAEPANKFIEDLYESSESLALRLTNDTDVSVLTAQRFYGRFPVTPVEMALDYWYNDFTSAEPPRITSLKNTQPLPTDAIFGDDVYFVHDPRGYKSVVHHLANSYLENKNETITDNRLKLNTLVNKIEYSKEGVEVTTKDGTVYTSDYAIVSVSLGVLQSTAIDFVPDLPFWKLKAIYTFDMAVYTKIFLKFSKKFWSSGSGNKFWLYADERRGYYPIWENLDSEFPDANVLMVTVTDEESRRIEQQPDSETLDEIMGVLKNMFGKDVPTADDIYVPKWVADPLFRGSYSNWPVGAEPIVFQQLQAPVENIYFTGEHTSELYSGYVHGAHLQGMSIANSLLDCKKNQKCAPTAQVYDNLSRDCAGHLEAVSINSQNASSI
ncbi:hypothetical protein KC19_11G013800 [Ceratodon purpureus]|uniref:Amine oxidase domain-containing protein n=1 Tax=Ceratodon purpureus TaxID=3225 RepID=A0A8T0GFH4_CERPU|nr:hypothetical protein KC19_11G013800 [Ceratodon purpureus]